MNFIRKRVLAGEFMCGAWCNLASSITVEMASQLGYDWILLDQEHGPGDNLTLLHQIQAADAGGSAGVIVRIAWNEMPRFKRVLDLGAAGVMVPYVQTEEEARYAVDSLRYTPQGMRGAAGTPRAAGYGRGFAQYYAQANQNLLTVVQIETQKALDNLEAIAAVDGVDVLFVGPLDLSISLDLPGRFEDEDYCRALEQVAQAAKQAGKAAGILLPSTKEIPLLAEMGYTFIAVNSDGGIVVSGMAHNLEALSRFKG